jgi:hypothetical protein
MTVPDPQEGEAARSSPDAQPGTIAQPARTAPLRDRNVSFGIRGRALIVAAPVVVLGSVRNSQAHIPLLGRLHRRHALVSRVEGRYSLSRTPHHDDLVAVNGADITSTHALQHGDRIELGAKEGRGRCKLTFLIPDAASTTAVLRQEKRWIVTASGDAFDRIVLLDREMTIGRSNTSHIDAPLLACPEVRLSWSDAGLAVCATGGNVYQETPNGEWDDPPIPLAIPCRLFVAGNEDLATQVLSDYRQGGDVDERLDLVDPTRRM